VRIHIRRVIKSGVVLLFLRIAILRFGAECTAWQPCPKFLPIYRCRAKNVILLPGNRMSRLPTTHKLEVTSRVAELESHGVGGFWVESDC